ncbi:hypothetical protein OQA88_7790 [Cercophora sp. LCS_1]
MNTPSSSKRKRSPPRSPTINPLSHSPSTLRQLVLAGHSSDLPLPSDNHPSFPHRPIPSPRRHSRHVRAPSQHASDGDDEVGLTSGPNSNNDSDTDGEEIRRKIDAVRGDRAAKAYRKRVGPMAAVVQRFLSEGDIESAKRAFGLLQKGLVYGTRVDLRHGRYWEMGVEILMREGEDHQQTGEGKLENLKRIKSFYETMAQMHPWSRMHPNVVSALDFYPGVFGIEMEAVYLEHKMGTEKVAEAWRRGELDGGEDEDDVEMEDGTTGMGYEEDRDLEVSPEDRRLRRVQDGLRRRALEQMRELEVKMDGVMEAPPFSKDHELLRLRGMVALYIADLCVPLETRSEIERLEGERVRNEARDKAKTAFRAIKKGGGELGERWIQAMIEEDDEEEAGGQGSLPTHSSLPMYSSLPIR